VIEAFSELAPSYEPTIDRELRQWWGTGYWEFVNRFVAMAGLTDGEVILDVATGTAQIPRRLLARAGQAAGPSPGAIVGLDITPEMLLHGRAKIVQEQPGAAQDGALGIWLVCASGMEMPFASGSFDKVLCGLGTHHMQVDRMLAEMRRVLRQGGRLLLADVGGSAFWRSAWGRAWLRVLMLHFGLTHSRARTQAEVEAFPNILTVAEWRSLLSKLGFVQIEIAETAPRRRWYPRGLLMSAVAGE
jgi:ubiquinone/menaquinone biosynthesis C-methylase UbiE